MKNISSDTREEIAVAIIDLAEEASNFEMKFETLKDKDILFMFDRVETAYEELLEKIEEAKEEIGYYAKK